MWAIMSIMPCTQILGTGVVQGAWGGALAHGQPAGQLGEGGYSCPSDTFELGGLVALHVQPRFYKHAWRFRIALLPFPFHPKEM